MGLLAIAALILMAPPTIAVVPLATADSTPTRQVSQNVAHVPGVKVVEGWTEDASHLDPPTIHRIRARMRRQGLKAVVVVLSGGYMLLTDEGMSGPWTVFDPLPGSFTARLKGLGIPPGRLSTAGAHTTGTTSNRQGAGKRQDAGARNRSSRNESSQAHASWKLPLFLGVVGVAIISGLLVYQYTSYDDSVEIHVYH